MRNAFPSDVLFLQPHRRSVKKDGQRSRVGGNVLLTQNTFCNPSPIYGVNTQPGKDDALNLRASRLSKKVLIKLFDWVVNKLCSYYSPCSLIQRPNETLGPTRVKHKGRSFCFSNPPIVSSQIDLSYMFCPWSILNNLEKDIWRCLKSFTVPFVKLYVKCNARTQNTKYFMVSQFMKENIYRVSDFPKGLAL